MALRTLDQKHKQLAEDTLRGIPLTQIARSLDVNRSTLYSWMRDTLWLAYFAQLSNEVEAARVQRMLPVVMVGAEAVEAALMNAVRDLSDSDPIVQARAPRLEILTQSLRTLAELERVDRGLPSSIRETRGTEAPKGKGRVDERHDRLVKALDDMVTKGEKLGVTDKQEADAVGERH